MKRKLFTFLFAFLATLSGAVWGQTTINLSSPQSGTGVSVSGTTIEINQPGDYVITGSTTMYHVNIDTRGHTNVLLQDVSINLNTSDASHKPISVWPNTTVDFTIVGENTISVEGNNQAAISVWNGASITIKGTGILRAEGYCGIGYPDGACGDITIESGTVVANGSTWCIGGAQSATTGNEPTLKMTGDALLVVYDESTNRDKGIYNMNYWGLESHPDHGIYCNAKAQADFGSLYSDVTLQSPFPSDDFVVDLNGYTLTLGAGSYARKDQIRGSGTLNAYEVVCTVPQIPNATMSTAPASMYYGPSTDLVAGDATATPENEQTAYDFLGWVNNSGNFMVATDAVSPTGIQRVDVTAVFLLTKYALNIVKGTTLSESFDLVYPKNANVTVDDTNSELGKYGAKLDDTKKKVVTGDAVATADETSIPDEVTLTATYNTSGTKDIKLSMTVTDNAVDISTGTLELTGNNNTKVYDGQAVDPQTLTWKIINGSETITPGGGLEVKFKKDKNDVDYMTEKPTDVGTYFVYVVAMSGDTYTGATTNDVTYTITEKTLTVTAEDVEWKKSAFSTSPIFTNKLTLSGKIESDDVSVTYGDPTGSWNIPGTYTVTYINLALEGTDRDNYTLNNVNTVDGKLIVTIDDGKPEENTDIKPGGVDGLDGWTWDADENRYERTYDGIAHPLTKISIRVQNGDKTEWKELSADEFEVTYEPNTDVKDAGAYKATVTINDAESYTNTTATINLYINPAELTINLNVPATIEKGQNVSAWWTPEMAKFTGVQNEEPAKIEGALSISDFENANVGGTVKAIITGLKLVENTAESKTFKPSNYNPIWINGDASITVTEGNAEIDNITVVDPKPNYPEEIKPGDEGWKWDDDAFTRVYDGQAHEIQSLIVGGETLTVGKDYTVVYNPSVVKNAGSYTAVITFTNPNKYQVISMPLTITKRPSDVNLNVPTSIDEDQLGYTSTWWNPNMIEFSNLVTDEIPNVEATLEVSVDDNVATVIIRNIKVSDNDPFFVSNYDLTYKNGSTNITFIDADGDGEKDDVVISDMPVNPSDDGDSDEDGDSDIKLFRIYTDEVCAGVELEYSREVVKGGQSTIVTVNVEKGYDASALKLSFKRGLYGDWEPLTLNKDGQYQIKNIWKDIYVRAEGVVTGMEDIDGAARVYAKDGSLYIYTPQQDDITVVSMTGAVVKRTKQIGLQSYPLNQGIYVVRVGEQVFKIRVK